MTISIDHYTTIRDVQRIFQAGFPFLNIEFSITKHEHGGYVHPNGFYDSSFRLSAIARKPVDGSISIRPWQLTGEVEHEFEKQFGLFAQVLRREGNHWIQSTETDNITLEKQNQLGEMKTLMGMQNSGQD